MKRDLVALYDAFAEATREAKERNDLACSLRNEIALAESEDIASGRSIATGPRIALSPEASTVTPDLYGTWKATLSGAGVPFVEPRLNQLALVRSCLEQRSCVLVDAPVVGRPSPLSWRLLRLRSA